MWIVGAVTNTGYDGMPHGGHISKLRSLERGSVADKPHTSCCPSVSVADITACATSPARFLNLLIIFFGKKIMAFERENFETAMGKDGVQPYIYVWLFLLTCEGGISHKSFGSVFI